MTDANDYTVGWVCAVEVELVAAQELLDEEHDPIEVPVNDNNSYTLGRIGKHNVVIAALPYSQYGLVSAASVARDMIRSFPNVRIGLMVGVGGGAPSSRHDIRLGDVVVSTPGKGTGGVLQYDYGKTVQGAKFMMTGYLNEPPQLFLTALSQLGAQYRRKGHGIDKTVELVCENNPRLRSEYQRPDFATDRLYCSSYIHNGEVDCTTSCDEDNLIARQSRNDNEDNPAIHYGLIASANRLMKDALLRDELSTENDVLCFEMEAAGLVNHFPCLVIRGICDYSDSHKNDAWQGYAAMTAAAYAKDLLNKIAPNKIEAERRLSEITQVVCEDIKELKSGVESLRVNAHFDDISNWLSPSDPSMNYNKALNSRHPGSGKWLLHDTAFMNWKSERNPFLWLYGIPGCGKTVLSSTVIEDLSRGEASQNLLYFYFDFSDTRKQNLDMMLRSLILQLYMKCSKARSPLDLLYEARTQPSLESLQRTFQGMIQQAGEVWIVIDALDECPTRGEISTGGVLWWIQRLQDSDNNVHLIMTSRPEQDIEAAIRNWARHEDIIPIQSSLIEEDIKAYIHARVREPGELSKRWYKRSDIQGEIEATLSEKADGMFRWASCQLDELEKCLSPREIRKALVNLPRTLDETYARILANIPPERKQAAIRILQFISFSDHPINLEEAIDIIAVDIESETFDPGDRNPIPEEISRYCSSLVVVVVMEFSTGRYSDEMKPVIQLAHFSVKEYLVSDRLDQSIARDFETTAARKLCACVCLVYLLAIENKHSIKKILELYPLSRHAAESWLDHGRASKNTEFLAGDLVARLFASQRTYETFYRLSQAYDHEADFVEDMTVPTMLYYTSYFGLDCTVKSLLKMGPDIDARGGDVGGALQAASCEGHDNIVQILLDHDADINAGPRNYCTALNLASSHGHENTVRMLLTNGADVNAPNASGQSGLQAASEKGHETIVQIFLANGADVNAIGGFNSATRNALFTGHEYTVQMFLSGGLDVNAYGAFNNTALQAVSFQGHENIVRILLVNGADVNESGGYRPALQAASNAGKENIVQILIANGADVNQSGRTGTALQEASIEGHENIVQILIANGANVNQSGSRGNALWGALHHGHDNVARILLDKGARLGKRPTPTDYRLLVQAIWGSKEDMLAIRSRKDGINIRLFRLIGSSKGAKRSKLRNTLIRGRLVSLISTSKGERIIFREIMERGRELAKLIWNSEGIATGDGRTPRFKRQVAELVGSSEV